MQATQQRSEPIDVVVRLRIALGPGRAEIARHENAVLRVATQNLGTDAGARDQLQHDGLAVAIDLQLLRGLHR